MRAHAGIASGPATCPLLPLGRTAPTATNEMHGTSAERPIGFRIEGVLARIYVSGDVPDQILSCGKARCRTDTVLLECSGCHRNYKGEMVHVATIRSAI